MSNPGRLSLTSVLKTTEVAWSPNHSQQALALEHKPWPFNGLPEPCHLPAILLTEVTSPQAKENPVPSSVLFHINTAPSFLHLLAPSDMGALFKGLMLLP